VGFKRSVTPILRPDDSTLMAWMAGLGMSLDAEPDTTPNIEDVLIFASEAGMVDDLQVLSFLISWLSVHHARVNARGPGDLLAP